MATAQQHIESVISEALKILNIEHGSIVLERPVQREHGDFASNMAMVLAKQQSANPRELATKIVQEISKKKPDFLEKIEVAGPGFINFSLAKKYFEHMVFTIRKEGETYGHADLGKGRIAIVEFSSPNIAKPFTIGHLRSTIIGDAVANILAFSGYSVMRDNHLGDWGTQFGKEIVAIKKWGSEAELDKSDEPVKMLVDLYVKFHTEAEKDPKLDDEARAWFAKLEAGDKEARRLWKKCIDWSMVQFNAIYKQLGVKFDMMLGESFFEDKMTDLIAELKKKKIATVSQGALLVFFPDDKYPPLMIQKKDGATLYSTRDLATDRYRVSKWGKDVLIV
ncbi:MAG TPA: arginine--tRNA ligase, partial [Candidatus Saccharimonadia bacterium]|nr:arginine--tRNA ligase [Candidatus Saccharimonadia bacterium]